MKMRTKIFSFLLVLIMLFSVMPLSVLADSFVVAGEDFEYYPSADGGYSITGYDGDAQVLEIPSHIDGIPVTMIENLYNDFRGYKVIIPETVKRISDGALVCNTRITEIEVDEDNAFYCDVDGVLYDKDVTTLVYYPEGREDKTYTLPDTVTDLAERCCHYAKFETFNFSSNLKKIGMRAFYYAENLKEVILPEGLEIICDDAFMGCRELQELRIPDSVKTIEGGLLDGCSSVKSVHIGSGVESLAYDAFEDGASLEKITVAPDNKIVTVIDNVLFNKDMTSLIKYPANKADISYTIPSSVVEIKWGAFKWAKNLENLKLSDNLTELKDEAITECYALKEVRIPDKITYLGLNFSGCDAMERFYIGKSVTAEGAYGVCGNCDSLKEIVVDPENPYLSSQGGVLYNKDKTEIKKFPMGLDMKSYKIPSSVREIGNNAFYDQKDYYEILMEKGEIYVDDCLLEYGYVNNSEGNVCVRIGTRIIGKGAFWGEGYIWGISLPEETEIICTEAFGACDLLQSIYIPAGVKYMGSYTFAASNMLSDIYFGGTEVQWNRIENIENVSINENVTIHFESKGNEFVNPVLPEDMYKNTYVDEKSGISVSTDTDATLCAEDVMTPEIVENVASLLPKAKVESVYEINLQKDGEEIQPEDRVLVKIPAKNRFARVYRMEEDGSITDMNAIYEAGYLWFYTDHFSFYALGMKQAEHYELGDVDMNEVINVKDATAVQKHLASIQEYQPDVIDLLMDFDNSGNVNIKDATAIQKRVAGLA